MPKPELELFDVNTVEWTPVPSKAPGQFEKVLAQDPVTGVASRLLRLEPGCDTSANGVQIHDFWEELYILEGYIIDLSLGQTFHKGFYACRPPGMKHGPWIAPEGCVTFEVRYPAHTPPR